MSRQTHHFRRPDPTSCRSDKRNSLISNDSVLSLHHDGLLATPESPWIQSILLQQPVKLGSIAIGQPGRVGDIAIRQL
ncbi:hypothetical protein ACP3V9_24670, partial [Salmonella enterica]|uniref:hypothetical protein n=1 Tax=Salmonella enterica TaxID=28901 RepID=UPI003CF442B4